MKKIIKKRAAIAIALAVALVGFYIDRKSGTGIFSYEQRTGQAALIKKNEPLTIYNTTGSIVNAAFYNKRFKRSGAVMCIKGDKLDAVRHCNAPYLAVARNKNSLRDYIEISKVSCSKINRSRYVKVASRGSDLVITSTLAGDKHRPFYK